MKYVRVAATWAESAKGKLLHSVLFDKQRSVLHSDSYVLFPIKNISEARVKKLFSAERYAATLVDRADGSRKQGQASFRGLLAGILTDDELKVATKGYDILGNIAVIDVPAGLRRKEKRMAGAILKVHPSVRTVVAKAGAVSGRYRRRAFRHVAGERNFIADYRENGCRFRFDIRKAFFSNRLSYERARVTALVKRNENVVVMFAGVGPFAIEMAKAHRDANVVGIELNRYAYQSMLENIALNKLRNVKAVLGDVKKVSPKFRGFADRVVMPMPKESSRFLDEALMVSKRRSTVHAYAFGQSATAFDDFAAKVMEHARRRGYRARVAFQREARAYSPREIEVVVDYTISK